MMKKLLKKTVTFIALVFGITVGAQNFVVTYQNIPSQVEVDGDFTVGDELRFTIANIPNDNVDRNANFRFYSDTSARHSQIVFDISFDNSDPSSDVTIDGADIDNGDGTFTRKFIASKISPRSGTAGGDGTGDFYTVGDVLNSNVRVTTPNIDNFAELTATTTVVADNTLRTNDFNKSKLAARYNASTDALVFDSSISGKYAIYNLLGQSVKQGTIAREVGVSTLKSGMYILTTDSGTLKFAK